jgi:secreted trypsin-like serine protease
MSGFCKTACLLLVLALLSQSNAIIIRHDKSYGDYIVRESEFPAVFYLEKQGPRKVCVATLIHKQWAITAAHCADQTSLLQTLNAGGTFDVLVSRRSHKIDKLIIHPQYISSDAIDSDLALLHFAAPLDFPKVIPINTSATELNQQVTIMGWGFFGLGTAGREYDDGEFRRAQNIVDSADQYLSIHFDDPRTSGSPVLELEGTIGLGDSGGPALVTTDSGWALAGVAVGELEGEDFQEETQGKYGSTAVYERISLYQAWIEATIASESTEQAD